MIVKWGSKNKCHFDRMRGNMGTNNNTESNKSKKSWKRFINIHVLLLLVFLIFVLALTHKFSNWGEYIDLDEIFADGPGTYEDTLDEIIPLRTEPGPDYVDDGVTTIVAFGNAPFADDRDSEDSLSNIIEDMTGATVYNCAINGSYLASNLDYYDAEWQPFDAFTFYWLCALATDHPVDNYYTDAKEVLKELYPQEADYVVETLTTLDFNTVDVITVMYDGTDYLMGYKMYNDANDTDITTFTGNLEAGIELIQNTYPHIRIIVMSPPYAYAVDDNGEYMSSDIRTYGEDVLSTYVIKQYSSALSRSCTFIDHLYGTITEDNASQYLIDNYHLNVAGRQKVAERFVHALTYFDEKE